MKDAVEENDKDLYVVVEIHCVHSLTLDAFIVTVNSKNACFLKNQENMFFNSQAAFGIRDKHAHILLFFLKKEKGFFVLTRHICFVERFAVISQSVL